MDKWTVNPGRERGDIFVSAAGMKSSFQPDHDGGGCLAGVLLVQRM